ncbi:MAG: hypothetical protein ACLQIK_20710 [Mycobacterium sp.]|uniref:hypothetical protein n=1 Tax=Mycobacterium sp. TaxID=1785 RepID=UPI003F96C931
MADDELDSLYSVPPDAFTAERTKLAAAAKKRGDTADAKRISAARKPTTAAWIVNRLALTRRDAAQRLGDLGDRLRDAHGALNGDRIRELSAQQHKLIDQLARAAFDAAGVESPSSSVRDDVAGTLQAAVADPDVRSRLGRLARPEQWSGFGAFADATTESAASTRKKRPDDDDAARRRETLNEAVNAAERAKVEADDALSKRQAERDAAARRRDDAFASLRVAEDERDAAEDRYGEAKQAGRAAAESVKEALTQAKAQLKRA